MAKLASRMVDLAIHAAKMSNLCVLLFCLIYIVLLERVLAGDNMLPQHRREEKFIKGPIPHTLITRAFGQSCSAGATYLAIWQRAGMRKRPEVSMPYTVTREWGLADRSVRRALVLLKEARLITIRRRPGNSPVVTLLDPER
jgi:hypothetical protein